MTTNSDPTPDILDISEYRQPDSAEKGQHDPSCWRDGLPDELHSIGQQCIEADEHTAQAERSVIEAYYDEGEKLTSFKRSLKDAGVKRQFVALCDSMGIEPTRRKRAMRIYDYLTQQDGRDGCVKYGTLTELLGEITASRSEKKTDDEATDQTGSAPGETSEHHAIAARLLAGGDGESGGSGGDGDDAEGEGTEGVQEPEEGDDDHGDVDAGTDDGGTEPVEEGEPPPTLDETAAFGEFARSVLSGEKSDEAFVTYCEAFGGNIVRARFVMDEAVAQLRATFDSLVSAVPTPVGQDD